MAVNQFWTSCVQMLQVYPQRPSRLTKDSPQMRLRGVLEDEISELASTLVENPNWLPTASVGFGNWAAMPWVAVFDRRETTSAKKGVYSVVHLSPDEPTGIGLGIGVSATEFRGRLRERAIEVYNEFRQADREVLAARGFSGATDEPSTRPQSGSGELARGYADEMIFEKFVPLSDIEANRDSLDEDMRATLGAYKAWIEGHDEVAFLELMRRYRDERTVFQSPAQGARYCVGAVDETSCEIVRLDAEESEKCTASAYSAKIEVVKGNGSPLPFAQLDGTVARRVAFAQGPRLAYTPDRKSVVFIPDTAIATQAFSNLLAELRVDRNNGPPNLYKPSIVACVVEGIDAGELKENMITFDWLLPRFVEKMKTLGSAAGEEQAALGFFHLTSDLFWMLCYKDPKELITSDQLSPGAIRAKVRHAMIKEPFWDALQDKSHRATVLEAISISAIRQIDGNAVNSLCKFLASKAFVFEPWQVAAYVTALRTKGFVILAGISGTGKSKLPALVAQGTGGQAKLLPVRPDWTDSSDVLGYIDIEGRFRPGTLLEFVREAADSPAEHFVCIIDEMNLARVEHYFAEVLSRIEDRRPADGGGFKSSSLITQRLQEKDQEWASQALTPNIAIVGTVNMDESAHGFSRKVLDRAFTIELSDVSLESWKVTSLSAIAAAEWPVSAWYPRAIQLGSVGPLGPEELQRVESAVETLADVNKFLINAQLQVGYRTRDEVGLFVLHASTMLDAFVTKSGEPVDPLDLALQMKVLPRLAGGSNAVRRTVLQLLGWSISGQPFEEDDEAQNVVEQWDAAGRSGSYGNAGFPRTAARLCLMWERLRDEGFTSFWA